MLDPYKRKTDFNRDLIAVGAGNALAGVLGGLPMISEVARSSANVNNGGKTRWANFFHGLFLLVFVALLSGVIEMIPKAALAALLIGVGFKLAHPKEFAHTLKIGRDQFAVFLITIFFTLYEDLLIGIASGIILEIVLHLINGASFKSLFSPSMKVSEDGSNLLVKVSGTPVFTNFIGLKKRLENLPKGRKISLDFSSTKLIDHTVMEGVHHFELEYAESGGSVHVTGLDGHSPYSQHSFAARKKSNVG
jgi:MFS superfamily sulfate permease-like transporter